MENDTDVARDALSLEIRTAKLARKLLHIMVSDHDPSAAMSLAWETAEQMMATTAKREAPLQLAKDAEIEAERIRHEERLEREKKEREIPADEKH